jgi:alpha-beta hydrolase superfamily lysophospholipase
MALNKKKIFRWIKVLIIIYCALGIALYYLQDYFLFHPQKLERSHVFKFNGSFEEVNIPINNEDTVNMVKFFPAEKKRHGVVIYFHGNMKNIERYAPFAEVFTKKGYEVWMPDYPGFGKTTGKLTEAKLYEQALQIQKLAMTHYHSDSIILYGKSLGTGIAAYAAVGTTNKMLILETPYSSIPDIFKAYAFIFPVDKMIGYKIPTKEYLQDVHIPVIVFAGTGDWVIPYRCAVKLKRSMKQNDRFISIPDATHNNLNVSAPYYKAMDSLLN